MRIFLAGLSIACLAACGGGAVEENGARNGAAPKGAKAQPGQNRPGTTGANVAVPAGNSMGNVAADQELPPDFQRPTIACAQPIATRFFRSACSRGRARHAS